MRNKFGYLDPRANLGSDRSLTILNTYSHVLVCFPAPSPTRGHLFTGLFECSVILGRAIKTEYLAIGTLLGTVGLSVGLGGGSKDAKPKTIEQAKESVSLNVSSK